MASQSLGILPRLTGMIARQTVTRAETGGCEVVLRQLTLHLVDACTRRPLFDEQVLHNRLLLTAAFHHNPHLLVVVVEYSHLPRRFADARTSRLEAILSGRDLFPAILGLPGVAENRSGSTRLPHHRKRQLAQCSSAEVPWISSRGWRRNGSAGRRVSAGKTGTNCGRLERGLRR